MRSFSDELAVRTKVPLMIGLVGPSGGGKTFSALRLATGIQRVHGGEIYVVDTEARRALHYADRFRFRHVIFEPPFGPLDYLAAIEHCAKRGAGVVIVDSMSHEHEGPGGVLEMHETEMQRMGGGEKYNFMAWARPKAERRRMINSILQLPISAIFCFRAKEKVKPVKGTKELAHLGFMPIAGEEFTFEMLVNCLLLPNAGGVPTWQSDEIGERATMKLPAQFAELFASAVPLSEEIGEALARWAEGASGVDGLRLEIDKAITIDALNTIGQVIAAESAAKRVSAKERAGLRSAFAARMAALAAPPMPEEPAAIDDFPEPGSDG